LRDLTWLDRTGNVTPEPWDAVEISPPIVWSEMEPIFRNARGGEHF